MNSTPKPILFIIVVTMSVLAIIGVCSLAGTLFYKSYADPAVLSAFISITSGVIGGLTAILVNTRQPSPDATTVTTPSSPETQPTVTIEPPKP